jgi:hypothetical protein
LHAINRGVNAGDHNACNTSDVRPAVAGKRPAGEVLTLVAELRKGTINRIMAMSDLELGLRALLGTLPPGRP